MSAFFSAAAQRDDTSKGTAASAAPLSLRKARRGLRCSFIEVLQKESVEIFRPPLCCRLATGRRVISEGQRHGGDSVCRFCPMPASFRGYSALLVAMVA